MTTTLCDPRAEAVLARLARQARGEDDAWSRYFGERTTDPNSAEDLAFVRDKLIALDPRKCDLCYLLCRAIKARCIVEFGASFGVSTIHLAAAIRDNIRDHGGEGLVITTEIEPTKAAAAKANLVEAGLDGFVDLRVGDARETLKELPGPVDFLLLDSWIPMTRPVIDVVAPSLRPGAMILCDNVESFEREYADYTALVRNPRNGFRSVLLSHQGSIEISVKLA